MLRGDIDMGFDDNSHMMVESKDGSFTAYSKEYDEHYHSTNDGALHESLYKHVIPAFKVQQNKGEINILDICFGLGFNTLATILFLKSDNIKRKINIYSPELDANLIKSLKKFKYPKEFEGFEKIISDLVEVNVFDDGFLHIELFLGDAREYIKTLPKKSFDIVYQDAFSPSANPTLWTREYFKDIRDIIKDDGVITTYSIALKTRLALYENGFNIYLNSGEGFRSATIASPLKLNNFEAVDMEHKIKCNPDVKSLSD